LQAAEIMLRAAGMKQRVNVFNREAVGVPQ
jgi:tRNA threonylcarbamoyladenosine modification (KEOPS) complex Cgi121 subunit